MSLALVNLRPVQAMAAAMFFKHRRLLLALPRQYGGKTDLGVRLSLDFLSPALPRSGLFIAKDRKSGKKATHEKFHRLFPKTRFTVNTEKIVNKKCPTAVHYMDSADKDPDRMRGGTYGFIHGSEVAFWKVEKGITITDVFLKILAPTLTQTDGYAFLESTMNGKNGWFDLWQAQKEYGFVSLKLGLGDFVELGLIARDEYDKLKSETLPDIFRQEYECDWVTFQGATYPEFKAHHVNPDMPGPELWQTVLVAIDWGFKPSATCVLFGYVRDGVLNIFDEVYAHEQMPIQTAEAISARREAWDFGVIAAVADHDPARIEELNLRGIDCGLANKTNILGARMGIKEALFKNRLSIHPRCQNLMRELESAVWDLKKDGEIDYKQDTKGHFDAEAALRYMVRELSDAERDEPESLSFDMMDEASTMAAAMARVQ